MTQYPGSPDPDDPFAKAPKEGAGGGTEPTAPIRPEEPGYWEKLAQEQAAQQAAQGGTPPPPPSYQQNPTSAQPSGDQNPWAGYGEPAGSSYGTPPPPPPPAYGAPPPTTPYGYAPTGYAGGYNPAPPNDGLGLAAMIVGIVSFLLACGYGIGLLGSPVALIMGRISMKRIDRSNGTIGGKGMAQAGFIMGIIGTVLLVIVIAIVVVLVIIGLNGGFDSSYSSYDYSSDF